MVPGNLYFSPIFFDSNISRLMEYANKRSLNSSISSIAKAASGKLISPIGKISLGVIWKYSQSEFISSNTSSSKHLNVSSGARRSLSKAKIKHLMSSGLNIFPRSVLKCLSTNCFSVKSLLGHTAQNTYFSFSNSKKFSRNFLRASRLNSSRKEDRLDVYAFSTYKKFTLYTCNKSVSRSKRRFSK